MKKNQSIRSISLKIICVVIVLIMAVSMFLLCACTNQEAPAGEDTTEDSVRAADPMTEEEQEADDADGCIEDSEDLLY